MLLLLLSAIVLLAVAGWLWGIVWLRLRQERRAARESTDSHTRPTL